MANNGSGDFIFTTNLYKNPGKDSLLGPKKGKITGKELNKKKANTTIKKLSTSHTHVNEINNNMENAG